VSYHNERHYASVRQLEDRHNHGPAEFISLDNSEEDRIEREQQRQEIASWFCHDYGSTHINITEINIDTNIYQNALYDPIDPIDKHPSMTSSEKLLKETFSDISPMEMQIMQTAQCEDLQHIRQVMEWNEQDVDATIEYLIVEKSIDGNPAPTNEIVIDHHDSLHLTDQKQRHESKEEKEEKFEETTTQFTSTESKNTKFKCPCGSGRKYKKCCEQNHTNEARTMTNDTKGEDYKEKYKNKKTKPKQKTFLVRRNHMIQMNNLMILLRIKSKPGNFKLKRLKAKKK